MSSDAEKTQLDPSGGPQAGVKMKLGPYETVEILGRGGMAVVYKGIQQSLGRIVAIKVLPKEFSRDRQFVGRFHREAESVAKLNHPNIIQIIDKGEDQGTCYFVMEYVKGQSLGSRLASKGLTFKELVEIGLQVCSALHYAHEQGVVHRDIKPANILLDDTTGIAKVADFGIAQLAEKSTSIGTLTGDHMAMGTLDYMAPEQKRDAKNVDRRADVYSLGVMLYEMSTGRVPMGIFDPPSRIHKELPRDFDVIVMKCLRDKPDERFQSCLELSSALSSLPQSQSTMIRVMTSVKSGVTNIGTQIGRRNPRYIAAVLFLLAGLGIGSWAVWKAKIRSGSGGESSGSGPVTGGGGSTTPPDKVGGGTVVPDPEAAFRLRMKAADDKAQSHDYNAAIGMYEQLKPGASDVHLSEIALAIDKIKADQAKDLERDFAEKLQKLTLPDSAADAEYVAKLDTLLAEAGTADAPQGVRDKITAELAKARKAANANAVAASEKKRKKAFDDAIARISLLIDGNELDKADEELGKLHPDALHQSESDECSALATRIADIRGANATAEERKKAFNDAIDAAKKYFGDDDFSQALMKLKVAESNMVPGGEATVKALRDKIQSGERVARFGLQMDAAREKEISDPPEAVRRYREAAKDAPSQKDADEATARADRVEAGIKGERDLKIFNQHMDAARAAMTTHDWKLAEDEAKLALAVRKDDAEALKIQGDAHAQATAKPPDPPKLLTYKFKSLVKGKFANIKSIAVAPSGVVYATDAKLLKAFAIGKKLEVVVEKQLPYKYPDRVFVDPKGTVWATEWGNLSTINRLNPETLAVEQTVGGKGNSDGLFNYLQDIVVSADGSSIFGLEKGDLFRLQKISAKDGTFIAKGGGRYTGKGASDGLFKEPKNLALDKQGRVYVSDSALKNIQRFKADTSFDSVFLATPEFEPGAMAWAGDKLFVIDLTKFRVAIYSADAVYLGSLGTYGKLESQFYQPTGVAVSADGTVYVVDGGSRISLWEQDK